MNKKLTSAILESTTSSRPFTRRRFLQLLGAVGGTSLVLSGLEGMGMGIASAQNQPPGLTGGGNGLRVIVLGAGMAGMTAAYELRKLGYDTPILEARSFAGGWNQTARNGFTLTELGGVTQRCLFDQGEYINHGPWRIPFHHRSVLHYTDEFNVPLEIMVNENDNGYILYDDIDSELSGQRVRLMEVKADMRGYTAELLAKAANQDRLDAGLSQEDQERLIDYLVTEGALESEDLVYNGTSRRGYAEDPGAGLNPGEPSDPYESTALLRAGLGNEFGSQNSYSQQATMFQPVGGMDQIAQAFEYEVDRHITYNAEVQEIR